MRAAVWFTLLAASACDRGPTRDKVAPPPPPLPAESSAAPSPAARAGGPRCELPEVPLRVAAPGRLVAIGDLHGDLAAARAALRAAGAIDDADRWIGGDLVVVQTGDVLDRGDDEQAILDLLFRLEGEAKAAGGAMVLLLGNHELMNGAGDLRYVTPGGMRDFDDVPGLDTARWAELPEPVRGRIAALTPGGVYAKKLARNNIVAIVGDTVFSHAGVVGAWAQRLDEVNASSRCWLDGQAGGPEAPPEALTAQDSPVWTRALGGDTVDCDGVRATLATLGAKRMAVGHTIQPSINAVCDGLVWRIDVGMSRAYGGPVEILELQPTPRVIRTER